MAKPRISELFISFEEQVDLLRKYNRENEWGFTKRQLFEIEKEIPRENPDLKKLIVPVLDISLNSVSETFTVALNLALEKQINYWKSKDIRAGKKFLRLHQGIEFRPMTLVWRIIDLRANLGQSPESVCSKTNLEFLPHSTLLWAAFFFPNWIQFMNSTLENTFIPYISLAGYRITVKEENEFWRDEVPFIDYEANENTMGLGAFPASEADSKYAVPVFTER